MTVESYALGAIGLAIARLLQLARFGRATAAALRDIDELAAHIDGHLLPHQLLGSPRVIDRRARLRVVRAEHAQRDEPILAHLDEVARDAAVVANELALVGLGLGEV